MQKQEVILITICSVLFQWEHCGGGICDMLNSTCVRNQVQGVKHHKNHVNYPSKVQYLVIANVPFFLGQEVDITERFEAKNLAPIVYCELLPA